MPDTDGSMAALASAVDAIRQMREEDVAERRALAEAVAGLRVEVARLSARLDAIAADCSRECRPGSDRLSSLEEWRARADAALRVWRFVAGVIGAVMGSASTLAFQYFAR